MEILVIIFLLTVIAVPIEAYHDNHRDTKVHCDKAYSESEDRKSKCIKGAMLLIGYIILWIAFGFWCAFFCWLQRTMQFDFWCTKFKYGVFWISWHYYWTQSELFKQIQHFIVNSDNEHLYLKWFNSVKFYKCDNCENIRNSNSMIEYHQAGRIFCSHKCFKEYKNFFEVY